MAKLPTSARAGKKSVRPCACGAPLPHHLADLADDRFTHVCSCERAYKVQSGAFVLVGTEVNPIAQYDRGTAAARPLTPAARPLTPAALLVLTLTRATDEEREDILKACEAYPRQLAEEMSRRGGTQIPDADVVPMFVNICRTMLRSGGAGAS